MLTKFSIMLANRLVNENVIQKDDYEIYQFGLLQLLRDLLSFVSILTVGFLFSELLECLVFTICFLIIRPYAGGYHTSTPIRCYLLTMIVMITNLLACKYLYFEGYVYIAIGFISSIGIFINSPVASKNNPLDTDEELSYKKKARFILLIESCIAIIFFFLEISNLLSSVVFVLVTLCISQIVALLQEKYRKS